MGDIKIDQELVRSLLEDQHPDLAGLEIRAVGGGWDNMMWCFGDEFAVRLPRLTCATALLRSEQRWLPRVAAARMCWPRDLERSGVCAPRRTARRP
jgi:aminoglycoside phosphotransferase (APT) family kinase protein